jgi:hypothetical protein
MKIRKARRLNNRKATDVDETTSLDSALARGFTRPTLENLGDTGQEDKRGSTLKPNLDVARCAAEFGRIFLKIR